MRFEDKKRKMTVLVIAFVFIAILMVGCVQPEKSVEKPTKVKLAWFKGGDLISQYAAQDMGYFDDEGLEVEITYFKSSADAIPSIVAGDLEFGMTSSSALLKAIEAGNPIKAVGLVVYCEDGKENICIEYVSLKESGIKNIEDLKGKKVALPYPGSDVHLYMLSFLKNHGVNPDEVTFVNVPWPFQIEAMVKGEIDVAGLLSTHIAKMEAENIEYNTVADVFEVIHRRESVVIYTSEDYINEKPEVVRKFLKAFYKGQGYLVENPEAYRRLLSNYTGYEPQVLEKLDITGIQGLAHGGRFEESSWQDQMELMVAAGFLKEAMPINKIYEEKYLPILDES